jgi:hypothetical protein
MKSSFYPQNLLHPYNKLNITVRYLTCPQKINTKSSSENRPLRQSLGVEFQRILECKACLLKILVLEKMLDPKFLFLGFCQFSEG